MGSFSQVGDFTGGFAWTALESQSKSAQPYAQVQGSGAKKTPTISLHEASGRGTTGFAVRSPTKGHNETRSVRDNLEERASRIALGSPQRIQGSTSLLGFLYRVYNLDGAPSAELDQMDRSSSPNEVNSRTSMYYGDLYFFGIYSREMQAIRGTGIAATLAPCRLHPSYAEGHLPNDGVALRPSHKGCQLQASSWRGLAHTYGLRKMVDTDTFDFKQSGVSLQNPQDHVSMLGWRALLLGGGILAPSPRRRRPEVVSGVSWGPRTQRCRRNHSPTQE